MRSDGDGYMGYDWDHELPDNKDVLLVGGRELRPSHLEPKDLARALVPRVVTHTDRGRSE